MVSQSLSTSTAHRIRKIEAWKLGRNMLKNARRAEREVLVAQVPTKVWEGMVQMIMSTAEGAGGAAVNDRSMDDYAAAIRFGHQCTTELCVLCCLDPPYGSTLWPFLHHTHTLTGVIAQMGPMVRLVRVALFGVHLDRTVKVRRTPLPSFGPRHIPRSELSPKLYVSSSYLTSRATPRPASQGVHGNDAEPKLEIAANWLSGIYVLDAFIATDGYAGGSGGQDYGQ
jgi:hypothetical protein